ncbi:MAG TPA: protein kinase, partial [Thermoanaerobaculia bacterium]|nr:protein kinase [Thermoanaerobaculia bacterium]
MSGSFPVPSPERIGPYRVLRQVGAGGMGTVYQAIHEDLPNRTVAVKVVRTAVDSTTLRRRFERERSILARLAHPGIAQLYDGGTTADGRPYLVMEHVEGSSLLVHASERRLSVAARIRLFLEVCSAVTYAHERQVVHRDLKPSNILVGRDGLPRLLDFGVAKILEPAPTEGALPTLTAGPLMTPEYASPEQVRGEEVGPASDVYSLGVVLFELLTRRRPYRLSSRVPREVERVVCETDPQRPSTAVSRGEAEDGGRDPADTEPGTATAVPEGTPGRLRRRLRGDLDAILLKALRKEPADRYPSVAAFAEDLRRHLESQPVAARRGTWRYRGWKLFRRHRRVGAAALLAVAALSSGLLLARLGRPTGPRGGGSLPAARTFAILGVRNLTGGGDVAWIAAAFDELLRAELQAGNRLRAIPAEDVVRATRELPPDSLRRLDGKAIVRLRGILGCDLLLTGSFAVTPRTTSGLRVHLGVQDARDGRSVAETTLEGSPEAILDVVERAGADLRARLGIDVLSPGQARGLRSLRPSGPVATRAYVEGVAAVRRRQFHLAMPLLETAIAAEPDYPFAHYELAETLRYQGFEGRAVEEADRAVQLAGSLPRSERLLLEARLHRYRLDWDQAIAAYRALRAMFPDDLDVGLTLAHVQRNSRRPQDSLATLAELRRLPAPARDDPRIDFAEALALNNARQPADRARRERAIAAAIAKGEALGVKWVVAEARFWEVNDGSDPDRSERSLRAARRLFAETGDVRGETMAISELAFSRQRRGDTAGARALIGEAWAALPENAPPLFRSYVLGSEALLAEWQRRLADAREAYARERPIAALLGARPQELFASGKVAYLGFLLGEGPRELRRLEDSRAEIVRLSHEFGQDLIDWDVLAVRDERAPRRAEPLARELLADADPAASWTSNWNAAVRSLVHASPADCAALRPQLVEIIRRVGADPQRRSLRLDLADLALDLGGVDLAPLAPFEPPGAGRVELPDQPSAATAFVRALLLAGRVREARAALRPIQEEVFRSDNLLYRLAVAIDAARLRSAEG